jgi:L-alanine-DL-glutamate epimerase-like enolase superfamily enzyme
MLPSRMARHGRRSFLQSFGAAAGGLGVLSLIGDRDLEGAVRGVNRNSAPSDLKITDLRVAVVGQAPFVVPLVRIDTNQGLSGLGEVRDGGSEVSALMLKSRLVGENPCNVERVFRKIKQFGHHGRQGGGVSAVEMACWDLAGKAFGVPVYQMLGGKYRDKIRLYADTPESKDGEETGRRLKTRMDKGLTWLKVDVNIDLFLDVPGAVTFPKGASFAYHDPVMNPFTGIQLTDKGIALMADYVAAVRSVIGMDVPLGTDHFGHIDVNSGIRLARAFERHSLAWMEDIVPWQFGEQLRQVRDAANVPVCTGEDIYLKEPFARLIEMGAVDVIQPDLATAGGILETKKIGDLAMEAGVPMAMHFAGSPVSFMANLHCAAATENLLALEHHSLDVSWWEDLVTGIPKPVVQAGFATVPEGPGLGVELNEEVVKQHLVRPGYFEPTPLWDPGSRPSLDRQWS